MRGLQLASLQVDIHLREEKVSSVMCYSEQCQTSPDHLKECQMFSSSKLTPKTCGSPALWYSIVPLGMSSVIPID